MINYLINNNHMSNYQLINQSTTYGGRFWIGSISIC